MGQTKAINVRCTEQEHAEATAKAARAGYSLSAYVRTFILEWDGPSGMDDRMDDFDARLTALERMAGLG